jgi:hypothetical protein
MIESLKDKILVVKMIDIDVVLLGMEPGPVGQDGDDSGGSGGGRIHDTSRRLLDTTQLDGQKGSVTTSGQVIRDS